MREERDILKRQQSTLPTTQGKVRVHSRSPARVFSRRHVSRIYAAPKRVLRVVV